MRHIFVFHFQYSNEFTERDLHNEWCAQLNEAKSNYEIENIFLLRWIYFMFFIPCTDIYIRIETADERRKI